METGSSLASMILMGHHKLFYQDAKFIRDRLNEAIHLAEHIHETEQALVAKLYFLDQRKFYVRYGYKSLSGFCRYSLKFSKTQTQRIVTAVRRYEPTDKIVDEGSRDELRADPLVEAFLGGLFKETNRTE